MGIETDFTKKGKENWEFREPDIQDVKCCIAVMILKSCFEI